MKTNSSEKGKKITYEVSACLGLELDENGVLRAKKEIMSTFNVLNDSLELGKVGKYRFVEKDGMVYRIGENGVEFPPISKEEYEKMKKAREKTGRTIRTSEEKLKQTKRNSDEERND